MNKSCDTCIGFNNGDGSLLCQKCDVDTMCLHTIEEPSLKPLPEDNVNHPQHYCQNPKGIETIDFIEHMSYNLGNAIKYISRCEYKGKFEEDLNKAIWYIKRELERKEVVKD